MITKIVSEKKLRAATTNLYIFKRGTLPLSNGVLQNIRSLPKNEDILIFMLKNVHFSAA